MDKIVIKDLEIFAKHGVYAEEKKLGQKFIVSVEACLDLKKAAKTDDLTATVNYGTLCHEIEQVMTEKTFDLIETAAERISDHLLLQYPLIQSVRISLKKPWAPIRRPLAYAAVEIQRSRHRAYIALGANLGDKEKQLTEALEHIESNKYCTLLQVSSYYETEPVGFLDQDKFLNAAALVETLLTPHELMEFLLGIEKQLKRERTIRWGPRTIDLDILLYDDLVSQDAFVTIPHPRMEDRRFVMEPLCEIAPYAVHPLLHKTVEKIMRELT